MSLRLRFTVVLALFGVALFGTYALIAYRSEQSDLRASTEREIRIIGRSLETSIGNALRDRQSGDVDETLATLEQLEPTVDIHVHSADGHPLAHSLGAALDPNIEELVSLAATTKRELVDFQNDRGRMVFAAPVIDDDGALLGAMAIVRPTTDLEADLARTRWRMIAMLIAFVAVGFGTSLVLALADAREDRQRLERGMQEADKMIAIGQLSAGLAHEIGSPLQVLIGRASTLAENADGEVSRNGKILVAQSERIARIVEQLLSFGRRKAPQIASCDLAEPVRRVVELMSGEARRRGVALAVEVDGDDHRIEADSDQLQQVTLNLVSNALAATPDGGTITVRVTAVNGSVRLSVKDTGAGIPPEVQPRLFEPFFTTRAGAGGTGLGLAVVRAIADEHGGAIEVLSAPGKGAELVVTFPREQRHA